MINNKRGVYNEVMIVIVIFIALMSIIGLFWVYGAIAPIVVGQSQALTDELSSSINTNSPNSELANASVVPLQTANTFLGLVETISYLCILGGFLGFIAICFYVRTYRWLSMVWIVLVIGAVVVSAILSNAYQDMYNSSSNLADFYSEWGTNDFLLSYLPLIVGMLGVIGGIILFTIQTLGSEEETTEIQ